MQPQGEGSSSKLQGESGFLRLCSNSFSDQSAMIDPEIPMGIQWTQYSKTDIEKKNTMEDFMLPHFKIYRKAAVIKTVWD